MTLGSAVSGWRSFSAAPAIPTGAIFNYRLQDGSDWELNSGVYDAAAGTLTRLNAAPESSTGALLNLTTSATVTISALADDLDFGLSLSRGYQYIAVPSRGQSNIIVLGGTIQTMGNEGGVTIAPTNRYTRTPRNRSDSGGSTAGQSCGFRARNGGAVTRRDIGFRCRGAFGMGDAGANCRWFVGLSANGFLQGVNAEPNTLTEILGVGGLSGSSTVSWIENDASGTATMTAVGTGSLGGSAPIGPGMTEPYLLDIFNPPGGTPVLRLTRETTGDQWTRSPTTDLPALTTGMCFQWWRNTGAGGTTAAIDFMGLVEEYPR